MHEHVNVCLLIFCVYFYSNIQLTCLLISFSVLVTHQVAL